MPQSQWLTCHLLLLSMLSPIQMLAIIKAILTSKPRIFSWLINSSIPFTEHYVSIDRFSGFYGYSDFLYCIYSSLQLDVCDFIYPKFLQYSYISTSWRKWVSIFSVTRFNVFASVPCISTLRTYHLTGRTYDLDRSLLQIFFVLSNVAHSFSILILISAVVILICYFLLL